MYITWEINTLGKQISEKNHNSNAISERYSEFISTRQLQTNVDNYISKTFKFYKEVSQGNVRQAYRNHLQDLENDLNNISIIRCVKPITKITNGNTYFYTDIKNVGLVEAYKNHWNRMKNNAKDVPIIKKGLEHLENYKKHCEDFYQNLGEKGVVRSYLDHWNYMFNFF